MIGSLPALLLAVAAATGVSGVVFDDRNGNGGRDAGEAGLAGVAVSDGIGVAVTAADGSYRLDPATTRYVFVVMPGDRRAVGSWYHPRQEVVDFALAADPAPAQWRFAHLSDTHVDEGNVDRLRDAFSRARRGAVAFATVNGDLVRDALRVGEAAARGEYALYVAAVGQAGVPVRSVIGNHDVFAIEQHASLVPTTHPAYGKGMYEETLGPRYYAFDRGRVHFLVLDTVGIDDLRYYGFLDATQLDWIRRDLAQVPAGTTVVTVGHIPLRTGALSLQYDTEGPARTLLTVNGVTSYRHVVRNAGALEELLKPHRWTLALQGHTHLGEKLELLDGGATRYHTAPAVAREAWAPWPTGLVIYTVRGDAVDEGETVELDGGG